MIYKIVSAIVKFGTSILCRIDAPDLNKLPLKGPLIVYSNHTGQVEVAVLFGHLQPRPITGWAKVEAWDNARVLSEDEYVTAVGLVHDRCEEVTHVLTREASSCNWMTHRTGVIDDEQVQTVEP